MEYFDIPFSIAMVVSFVGPVKRLIRESKISQLTFMYR